MDCKTCKNQLGAIGRTCEGCGEVVCYPACYAVHMDENEGTCTLQALENAKEGLLTNIKNALGSVFG